jgi:large subunit ribosomal protein L29
MKITQVLSAIRESSSEELKARLSRLEEELFQHRLKRYTNQLENTNLIKFARREIARVRTVLAARAHGFETKAEASSVGSEGVMAEETKPAKKALAKKAAPAKKKAPTKKKAKKE